MGGDEAVFGVQAQHEAVFEAGIVGHFFKPGHVVEGAGAEDEAVGADGQEIFHGFFGADAAADFDVEGGVLHDFFDDGEVDGAAFLGAVEIDDVEPLAAGVLEFFGEVEGVGVVGGLLVVVALLEADDFAVAEVNGGDRGFGCTARCWGLIVGHGYFTQVTEERETHRDDDVTTKTRRRTKLFLNYFIRSSLWGSVLSVTLWFMYFRS